MRIAIAASRFNQHITDRLLSGTLERLAEHGVSAQDIKTIWVPGAVELPLMAQQFAMTEQFDAVICLGAVVYGETDHYLHVCNQVSSGCQKVALELNIPVIFGVLTTQTEALALARAGGGHSNKGHESADAAVQMIEAISECQVTADQLNYA